MSRDLGRDVPGSENVYERKHWPAWGFPAVLGTKNYRMCSESFSGVFQDVGKGG